MIGFSAEKISNMQSNTKGNVGRDIRSIKRRIRYQAGLWPAIECIRIRSNDIKYHTKDMWKNYFLERGFSIVDTTDEFGLKEVRIYWK